MKETKQQQAFLTNVIEAEGIVEAIVSVFGVIDSYKDIVMPGAYTKTLTENKKKLRVLDAHNADSVLRVIGIPLALREIEREELPAEVLARYPEATGGLWTQTKYLLDTPEGLGAFKRIAAGAVDEYSIGYETIKADVEKMQVDGENIPIRLLREIKLWEYGPVIWGANPATTTVGVKGDESDTDDEDTRPWPPLAPEGKGAGTVGVTVQAAIATEQRWILAQWLRDETISLDEYNLLSGLMIDAARMVYNGLPEDLRDRALPRYDEWLSTFPDGAKAGRVLSAKNAARIVAAHEALTSVISDAGLEAGDQNENADAEAEKSVRRDAERKAEQDAAEPRFQPLAENSLTAADVKRDQDLIGDLLREWNNT